MTLQGVGDNGRARQRHGAPSSGLCAKATAERPMLERGSSRRIRVMRYPTRGYQAKSGHWLTPAYWSHALGLVWLDSTPNLFEEGDRGPTVASHIPWPEGEVVFP